MANTSKKNYITTYSGRRVSLASGVPSLTDIAVHMSRIVRFTGAVRQWWTVLDHSLLMQELAAQDHHKPNVQLALLLHDAHEALFEDTPTPFKSGDTRQLQQQIDRRIFEEYYPGGWAAYANPALYQYKLEYDDRAVRAEALLVGPSDFQTDKDVVQHFGMKPVERDVVYLLLALRHSTLGGNPCELSMGHHNSTVQKFLLRYNTLRAQIDNNKKEESNG